MSAPTPLAELDIIASAERSIGMLYLSRHARASDEGGWVYEVRIDGKLLMSSVSPLSERELASRAIAAHQGRDDLRVLIGGLGLGYTAQAAVESPRAGLVRVVDAMDFVIQWLEDGLLPLSGQLMSDRRVELVQSDVYADLLGPAKETWDLILIDVDHAPDMPLDPASLPFYTREGQAAVAEHLAPGGILAVWSAFDDDPFADVMATSYAESWREEIAWVVEHNDENGNQNLVNTLFFGRKEAG